MSLVPELEDQLRRAARRTHPRRRLHLTWPFTLAAVLVCGGSLATAAVQLIGEPAPKTYPTGTPRRGPGVTVPGSVTLLALRVADPDGGAPWGLRVYRTSRGAGCWQFGRVVNGRLGVIDDRFHELPVQQEQCRPLDARGNLFAAQEAWALPGGESEPWRCAAACDRSDVRLVRFGFLGPEAVGVEAQGVRQPLSEGAYLLVTRVDLDRPPRHVPLIATYRDGTRIEVRDFAPDGGDPPPPGYAALAGTLPSDVNAPVRLTSTRRGKNTIYSLRFRAPVATRRYGVRYRVVLNGPRGGRDCDRPMRFAGFDTPGDVPAGKRFTIKLTPGLQLRYGRGWCKGTYRGAVVLQADTARTVGRFTFTER
jgi:hypothetical protein